LRYLNTTIKYSLVCLAIFCCGQLSFAQSKSELEQTRKNLNAKIETLSRSLTTLAQNKNQQISRYNTIESQIESRKELIETIQKEIVLLDQELSQKSITVDTLDSNFEILLEDYAQLLHIEYKDRIQKKNNLLSSGGILSALTKWRFTKQFESFLASKLHRINKANGEIISQRDEIAQLKLDKEKLLNEEKKNLIQMEAELESLDKNLISGIQERGVIETKISAFSSEREQLNAEIENYVYQSQSVSNYISSISDKGIQYKKGFLSWPVNKASVRLRYGKQYHPEHKNILIDNTGLDIIARDKNVSSISHGQVSNVVKMNGNDYTIIIQHDDSFYTVYSNLSASFVQKDDIVSSNQLIGELKSKEGQYVIHFEIWQKKENLNPTNWLKNN